MPKATVKILIRRTDRDPLEAGMIELDRERLEDLSENKVLEHLRNNRDQYGYHTDKDAGMAYFGPHEIPLEHYEGLSIEIVTIDRFHDLQRQELEKVKNVAVGEGINLGNPAHPMDTDQKHVRIGDMAFERQKKTDTLWVRVE